MPNAVYDDQEAEAKKPPVGGVSDGEGTLSNAEKQSFDEIAKNYDAPETENVAQKERSFADEDEETPTKETESQEQPNSFYKSSEKDTKQGLGSRAKGVFGNLKNRKTLAIIIGPAALIILILFLMSALKIPNYAANIAGYRMARTAMEYAKNSAAIDSEKIAVDTVDDATYKSAYQDTYGKLRSATWGKFDKYRPELTYKNMKADNIIKYNTEKTSVLKRTVIKSVTINGETIDKSQLSRWNFYKNYKARADFAAKIQANVDSALKGYSGLVRSSVAKKIRLDAGIKLKFWDNKGRDYSGKKAAEADRLQLQEADKKITRTVKSTPLLSDTKDTISAAEDAKTKCLADADCATKFAQTGELPEEISKTIQSKLDNANSILKNGLGIANPVYGIGVPACMVFDGSLVSSGDNIDAQAASTQAAFYGLESAADQQKAGDTTSEATGAFTRKIGGGDSIPDSYSRGQTVDTSGEVSPQASQLGEYTIASAILPSNIAGVVNSGAETVCPTITSVQFAAVGAVAALVAKAMLTVFTLGFGTAIEQGGEVATEQGIRTGLTTLAKTAVERVVASVATKSAIAATTKTATKGVWGFGKKFVRDFTAIEATTIAAKLVVLSKMGEINNAGTSVGTGFKNSADMGADIHNNEMSRQMFYGAPMTNKNTALVDEQTVAFTKKQDESLPFYQRYLATSNPRSLVSKFGYQANYFKESSGTAVIAQALSKITSIFGLLQPPKTVLADDGSDKSHYGIVQWGWTAEEDNLRNSNESYSILENSRILELSGKSDEIEAAYGKCFTESLGTILSEGWIVRAENGDVIPDEGDCSPQNLGPHNQKYEDLVFRWRLDKSYQNTLDQNLGIQDPIADTTTSTQCTDSQSSNKNLFMIGDSLSDGMVSAGIEAKLKSAGWSPTIIHQQGQSTTWGIQQVKDHQDAVANAGVIVVELGTNDGNSADFKNRLENLYTTIRDINSTAKVYWVNYISVKKDPGGYQNMTAKLQDFAQANNITIINWAGIGGEYVTADSSLGIHPANYGPFVDLVVSSVQSSPGCSSTSATGWVWPIKKEDLDNWSVIKSNENASYGLNQCWMNQNNGGYHAAIDIDVTNKPVYAATTGTIQSVKNDSYNTLIIKSSSGDLYAVYEHMSTISVKQGDSVTAGQQIGISGEVGAPDKPHLHFGITTDLKRWGVYADPWATVNPLDYLPNDYSSALLREDAGSCLTKDIKGKTNYAIPATYRANGGTDERYL